jgi:hypothetical protein
MTLADLFPLGELASTSEIVTLSGDLGASRVVLDERGFDTQSFALVRNGRWAARVGTLLAKSARELTQAATNDWDCFSPHITVLLTAARDPYQSFEGPLLRLRGLERDPVFKGARLAALLLRPVLALRAPEKKTLVVACVDPLGGDISREAPKANVERLKKAYASWGFQLRGTIAYRMWQGAGDRIE